MFIAHLPAGYLLADALHRRQVGSETSLRWLLAASMSGAVAPDMDLFYFFLLDDSQHDHHSYFTHWPLTWLLLLGAAALCWRHWRKEAFLLLAVFAASGFGHTVLDSVVGGIAWLAPWSAQQFSLWRLQAHYQPWWLNFILHPSFFLELLITATALAVAWRSGAFRPLFLKQSWFKQS